MGKASSRFKVFEDYYISKREADDEQLVENLKYYEELERQKLKILLLGTACAGKSTFLRQLRLLYGDQYTDEELVVFLSTIHLNLICSMKILVQQSKQLQISGRIVSKKSFDLVDQYSGTSSFLSKSLLTAIKELWSDPIIKTIWDLREEYGDTYSVDYLFDRCAAIATAGYMPDSTDVSHCYLPTTGSHRVAQSLMRKEILTRNLFRRTSHFFLFIVRLLHPIQCLSHS